MASTNRVRPDDERKLLAGYAVTKVAMLFAATSFRVATGELYAANRIKFTIANESFVNESKYVRQAVKCQDASYSAPRTLRLHLE